MRMLSGVPFASWTLFEDTLNFLVPKGHLEIGRL